MSEHAQGGGADPLSGAAEALSSNIRQLRGARGLSQAKCATIAGIPRPTWASLETGVANPTLSVLLRVAAALSVSVEELLRPPPTDTAVFRRGELPQRTRGGCRIQHLLPESVVGLHMERLELQKGAAMGGVPHTEGTREYLVCERGSIALTVAGETFVLEAGDSLAFRGNQRHSYRNVGRSTAVAVSVIALAPY